MPECFWCPVLANYSAGRLLAFVVFNVFVWYFLRYCDRSKHKYQRKEASWKIKVKSSLKSATIDGEREKKKSPVPTPAGHQGSLFAVNMAACGGASNERSASADVKTQKREITELMEKKLVKGDTW